MPENVKKVYREKIKEHIERFFGAVREIYESPGEIFPARREEDDEPRVAVCRVAPTFERPFHILVTMGMGERRMTLPKSLLQEGLSRAELVLCMPEYRDFSMEGLRKSENNWPLKLLWNLAKMPFREDSWLGWGHMAGRGDTLRPYDKSVGFCASLLVSCASFPGGGYCFFRRDGENFGVNFYKVVPLYKEEMEYKVRHGTQSLLELFDSYMLSRAYPDRPNAVTRRGTLEYERSTVDSGLYHIEKIGMKNLDTDPLCAYNHILMFLDWAAGKFLLQKRRFYRLLDIKKRSREGGGDVRWIFAQSPYFSGNLNLGFFTAVGQSFVKRYMWGRDNFEYNYFADIDEYASGRFTRREAEEMDTEEYLFLPYDSRYRRDIEQLLDFRYAVWQSKARGYGVVS